MAKKAKKIESVKAWAGKLYGVPFPTMWALHSEEAVREYIAHLNPRGTVKYTVIPVLIVPITPKRRKKK